MRILITGANGQLGQELNQLAPYHPEFEFIFYTKQQWDICDPELSEYILKKHSPGFLINAAAYTKVDQAEDEPDLCFRINAEAPRQLASICKSAQTQFIHISTDYVFNSTSTTPIKEYETKNPKGVYAVSKSQGEDAVMSVNPESIIIRTSWLYSSFGHNFVKTMYKLGHSGKQLNVVSDQTGNPTYAKYLAQCILQIISNGISLNKSLIVSGYYHYCNQGSCSWYDFAEEIFRYLNIDVHLTKISTADYGAKAWRPQYSSLDCDKIQNTLRIKIPHWKTSLHECLDLIRSYEMNKKL